MTQANPTLTPDPVAANGLSVTDADRNIQESALDFQSKGVPKVTHLIAAR